MAGRQVGHQRGHVLRGAREQAAGAGDEHRFVHAELAAQALELGRQLGRRALRQVERHGTGLALQVLDDLLHHLLAERDAALERGVHLDVEP